MRIGIDASNIRGGGGLTHLRQLINASDPQKHLFEKLIVWASSETIDRIDFKAKWLEFLCEPKLDQGLLSREIWRRKRLPELANEKCDLLFVPGGLPVCVNVPWVTMSQNLLPFENREKARYKLGPGRMRFELLRYLQAKAFESAGGVIFLTEYAKKTVCEKLKKQPNKTAVVPHGINTRFFKSPRTPRTLANFDRPLRLLYISTINEYKHQWHVADAVNILRREGWPVRLDLIGGGYEPALSRLKKKTQQLDPAGEWLTYSGKLPYEQLHLSYHEADLFIFASTCETFGQILLEAMAAGLPIACSNRSAMPEVIKDASEYFDPENCKSLVEAVRKLLKNPERQYKLASKAYSMAKHYSWQRCANETFAFLRKVYDSSKC